MLSFMNAVVLLFNMHEKLQIVGNSANPEVVKLPV